TVFISEDPTNALAPSARQNLEILAHNREAAAGNAESVSLEDSTAGPPSSAKTVPNSENLKLQLRELGDAPELAPCVDCDAPTDPGPGPGRRPSSSVTMGLSKTNLGQFTIRTAVDEVAQFFSVSSHGHMVSDLHLSNIHLRDNNKPPSKVLQFVPQSKLPLRLALLVDTSGSVKGRFNFEKEAAAKLLQKVLQNDADLAFVGGFSREITVAQDFTRDPAKLETGLTKLTSGGGTRLFDAVSFACWKLAEDPERERVARVLV